MADEGTSASDMTQSVNNTEAEENKVSSDVHSSVASVFNQHQNEIQRRSHISYDNVNSETFKHVEDGGDDLEFEIPDQKFIVFSLSHARFAPVAQEPDNPAVRLYGAFETAEEAVEHAKMLMSQDPNTSFMVNKTHEWIAAVAGPERFSESPNVIKRVLAEHETQRKKNDEDFKTNVEKKEIVSGIEDITDEVEKTKSQVDKAPPKTLKKLLNMGRVPDHNVTVGTFLKDFSSECEFIFKIYGFVESDAAAHKWVCNVVGNQVRDMDIDTMTTGQWIFPQSMSNKTSRKEEYRSTELNSIMKEHKAQPKRVEEFKREYETTES